MEKTNKTITQSLISIRLTLEILIFLDYYMPIINDYADNGTYYDVIIVSFVLHYHFSFPFHRFLIFFNYMYVLQHNTSSRSYVSIES